MGGHSRAEEPDGAFGAIFAAGTDGQRVKRAEMLSGVMRTVGGVAILGWFMRILREFGVDIDSMVLTVGSGGIAISFGTRSRMKNVITGSLCP
jgi:hypothetical protein